MRIHYFQHVPFEGLGSMLPLFQSLGHELQVTHLYQNSPLPVVDDFDALIVMGGPMGVGDEGKLPWMVREKALLYEVITKTRKPLLGICLGAQLIADVIGAPVTRNPQREIGWFPLSLTGEFKDSKWSSCLRENTPVFHWHGDTFAIPEGALPVGSSEACSNQGFIFEDRIVALQFHLETTPESAAALIRECADELDGGRYVQSPEEIMASPQRFDRINAMMAGLVNCWLPLVEEDDAISAFL